MPRFLIIRIGVPPCQPRQSRPHARTLSSVTPTPNGSRRSPRRWSSPQASNLLLDEIERAEVLPDDETPAGVVGMNATVEFLDEAHGARRTVQLVYPGEADIASGKISVLTPVGAGLIGLSRGQSILWPDRDGRQRVLKILRVSRQGAPAAS